MVETALSHRFSGARRRAIQVGFLLMASGLAALAGCMAQTSSVPAPEQRSAAPSAPPAGRAEDVFVVDCLLPGQIKKLGRSMTYLTPRRPIKTSAQDCGIRGGEYVAYDRSDYATALKVWLPLAQEEDKVAQTYVGEIYEKGLGVQPDYALASEWYRKAAAQGYTRAQINLGYLYEKGLGVQKDPETALHWYRQAAGLNTAMTIEPASINTEERKELQDLRGEVERWKRESASLRQQLEQTRQQAEQTQRQVERRQNEVDTARRQVEKVRQELKTQKKQAEAAQNDTALKRLAEQQQQREADLARQQQEMTQLRKERAQLEGKAEDYGRRLAELNERLREKEKPKPPPVVLPDPPIERTDKKLPPLPLGNYYALVIGNQDYSYWPKLETPQNDAQETNTLLSGRYGFKTKMLLNAKRYDILIALNELQKKVTDKDSLLIYYAGHGQLDDKGNGYWVPVDGEKDGKANWIQNLRITDILNTISAKHVLVVADTCYSGALTPSSVARLAAGISGEEREKQLKALVEKRSRTALTSGSLHPVKSGGGSQSLFAIAFLDVLRANNEVLTGVRVSQEVAARVEHAQYAPIQFAGHEAGDFVFVPAAKEYQARNRMDASHPPLPFDQPGLVALHFLPGK